MGCSALAMSGWNLAEENALSLLENGEVVPEIYLPPPSVRGQNEEPIWLLRPLPAPIPAQQPAGLLRLACSLFSAYARPRCTRAAAAVPRARSRAPPDRLLGFSSCKRGAVQSERARPLLSPLGTTRPCACRCPLVLTAAALPAPPIAPSTDYLLSLLSRVGDGEQFCPA